MMTNDSKDQGREALSDEQIRIIENDQASMPDATRDNLTLRTVRAALIAQHGFCQADDHCTCARDFGYRVCQPITPLATSASALARDEASVPRVGAHLWMPAEIANPTSAPQDFGDRKAYAFKAPDAGEHDPWYVVLPNMAALKLGYHADDAIDRTHAEFIAAAINRAVSSAPPAASSAATVSDAASVDALAEISSKSIDADCARVVDDNFFDMLATPQAATTAGAQDEQACKCRRLGDWKGAHHPLCARTASSATAPLTSDSEDEFLRATAERLSDMGYSRQADGIRVVIAKRRSTNGEQS